MEFALVRIVHLSMYAEGVQAAQRNKDETLNTIELRGALS